MTRKLPLFKDYERKPRKQGPHGMLDGIKINIGLGRLVDWIRRKRTKRKLKKGFKRLKGKTSVKISSPWKPPKKVFEPEEGLKAKPIMDPPKKMDSFDQIKQILDDGRVTPELLYTEKNMPEEYPTDPALWPEDRKLVNADGCEIADLIDAIKEVARRQQAGDSRDYWEILKEVYDLRKILNRFINLPQELWDEYGITLSSHGINELIWRLKKFQFPPS